MNHYRKLSFFAGKNCEKNENDCINNPCLNGGTCQDGINNYTCRCKPGYTGKFYYMPPPFLCDKELDVHLLIVMYYGLYTPSQISISNY